MEPIIIITAIFLGGNGLASLGYAWYRKQKREKEPVLSELERILIHEEQAHDLHIVN